MLPAQCRLLSVLALVLEVLLCWYLASYAMNHLPPHRTDMDDFNAVSAQSYLKRLTNFGPRPAGSYANDVLAVNYLVTQLRAISNSTKERSHRLDIDVQKVDGSFQLNVFGNGMAQVYSGLTNVVARISPSGAESGSRPAILVNAHFDSVPQGPGASDDGISCAVMLEVIRVLMSRPKLSLNNDIIFLFNGAEESILPAAHGFITQHDWVEQIKVFINLEAAGSGGRELLFQAGSSWLLDSYLQSAPHPFASVLAQEIFYSGLIPSDTDFRIFRDYGDLPGLDMAFIKDGYVYHTKHDRSDRIPLGSIQRAGDNVLAVCLDLLARDNLVEDKDSGSLVFFDVFGLFMMNYPAWAGTLVNTLIVISSLGALLADVFYIKKKTDLRLTSILLSLGASMAGHIVSCLLGVGFAALLGLILGLAGHSMTWFSSPSMLFYLYAIPAIAMTLLTLHFVSLVSFKLLPSQEIICQVMFHSGQTILMLLCLVLTVFGYQSGYIFSMSLAFNLVWWLTSRFLASAMHLTWFNFIIYLTTQMIPLTMWSYLLQLVFVIFVPIMGRKGTGANPDIMLGVMTAGCTYILTLSLLPLLLSLRRKFSYIVLASLTLIITLILVLLAGKGFPYSGDAIHPAPKRLGVYHARRTVNDTVDGGFLFAREDFSNTTELFDKVPEYGIAREILEEDCNGVLGCGVPLYQRKIKFAPGARWLSGSVPQLSTASVSADVIASVKLPANRINVTIEVRGPSPTVAILAPSEGTLVSDWSISDEIVAGEIWNGRNTYYIQFLRGLPSLQQSWSFWFILQQEDSEKSKVASYGLDMVLTGHHNNGQDKMSPDLKRLVNKYPNWVSLSSWTLDYKLLSFHL